MTSVDYTLQARIEANRKIKAELDKFDKICRDYQVTTLDLSIGNFIPLSEIYKDK